VTSGYAFYTPEAAARASYYGISGVPTAKFDGIITEVGGMPWGTMYPFYRHHVTTRSAISSPLVIDLTCAYDSITNTGTINATVNNTSGSTVSGNIHFVVIENNIPYNWGNNLTTVEHVLRVMLPNANGEAVTIPASGNIVKSRDFTINSSWNEHNCKIVVFVQGATKEIYQGAEIAVIQSPKMEYYGFSLAEITGNNNGWAEPGETIEIKPTGKNLGDGIYTGGASIQCADPYITITGATPRTVSIGPGELDTVINCTFDISSSCPDLYETSFELNFGSSSDNIPFVITTQSGFSDDIESGQGAWTHSGTGDNWHITEHKSNSPTHSWYSGLEGSWLYTNENIASLISPYFVVTPDSTFYFYHQYNLETNWDYAYTEIDNGSGWWHTLGEFNGIQSSWTRFSYPLNDYSGQTVRIRFRFVSDSYETREGWYLDDILIPTAAGIKEAKSDLKSLGIEIYPNPFRNNLRIEFNIEGSVALYGRNLRGQAPTLRIYDVTGRLIKNLLPSSNFSLLTSLSWNGTDDKGLGVPEGVYFIKLTTGEQEIVQKAILLR